MPQLKNQYPWVEDYVETGSFFNGHPRAYTVSLDGETVFFLRSKHAQSKKLDLYKYCIERDKEELLLDTDNTQLVERGLNVNEEDQFIRERLRQTSNGVGSYSISTSGKDILCIVGSLPVLITPGDSAPRTLSIGEDAHSYRLSPDGNHIAYIKNHCLWTYDIKLGSSIQLTYVSDQSKWGVADFISAEELDRYRGYWWSPDSKNLLVTKTDDSRVEKAYLASYTNQKIEPRVIRYPFAGSNNTDIELYMVSIETKQKFKLWTNQESEYLRSVDWNSLDIDINCISRDQKSTKLLTFNSQSKKLTYTQKYTEDNWIRPIAGAPCRWSGKRVNVLVGDKDSIFKIADQSIVVDGLIVDSIVGASKERLYFLANKPSQSDQRHVYCLYKNGDVKKITKGDGYHSATFQYGCLIINKFERAKFTRESTVYITDKNREHSIDSVAEAFWSDSLLFYHTLGPSQLKVTVCMPANYKSVAKKIPIIVNSYGGPGHQEVLSAGLMHAYSLSLAQEGYAVITCDGRGTPGRGASWEYAISHDLAGPVLEDQITALTEVCELYPVLDIQRVGVRGASFGGYLTLLGLLRRPDIFKAGVAIAPVTDWSLYDTYYTEKYLGQPLECVSSYKTSSLLEEAGSLSRPLHLVHGFADDNVLVSHSTKFFDQLRINKKSYLCEVHFPDNQSHVTPDKDSSKNIIINELDFFAQHLKR